MFLGNSREGLAVGVCAPPTPTEGQVAARSGHALAAGTVTHGVAAPHLAHEADVAADRVAMGRLAVRAHLALAAVLARVAATAPAIHVGLVVVLHCIAAPEARLGLAPVVRIPV